MLYNSIGPRVYSGLGDPEGLTEPGFDVEGNIQFWTAFVASCGSLGTLDILIKYIFFFVET